MKAFLAVVSIVLLGLSLGASVSAQDRGGGRYNQQGGINYAPPPGVFEVVSVDSDNRMVRMRAADGRTADVHVPDGVYDLSKLQPGGKIQVDFYVPNNPSSEKLKAAQIWPVR